MRGLNSVAMHIALPTSALPNDDIVMLDCGTCTPLDALDRKYAPYGRVTYSDHVPEMTIVSPTRYSFALEAMFPKL